MLDELKGFYRTNGISAIDFSCQHQEDGSSHCGDFVSGREAFVGSGYVEGELGRILFISLDSSDSHPGRTPELRTLKYMRKWEEERCRPDTLHKGRHWYWTHRLAFEIIAGVAGRCGKIPPDFSQSHRYFAHTNSAKCKDAALGTRQSSPVPFRNCREFIPDEVEIFRPDILITQGKRGRLAIEGAFPIAEKIMHPDNEHWSMDLLTLPHGSTLKASTTHQRHPAFWKEKREMYPWLIKRAQEFLSETVQVHKR